MGRLLLFFYFYLVDDCGRLLCVLTLSKKLKSALHTFSLCAQQCNLLFQHHYSTKEWARGERNRLKTNTESKMCEWKRVQGTWQFWRLQLLKDEKTKHDNIGMKQIRRWWRLKQSCASARGRQKEAQPKHKQPHTKWSKYVKKYKIGKQAPVNYGISTCDECINAHNLNGYRHIQSPFHLCALIHLLLKILC